MKDSFLQHLMSKLALASIAPMVLMAGLALEGRVWHALACQQKADTRMVTSEQPEQDHHQQSSEIVLAFAEISIGQ
ncbi:MAG: hypothetical protein AAGI37_19160 [Planctomycetota bacterium]